MPVREVITACTCDCPDTCSIMATVEGDRVTAIRGDPDFEITSGFLCRKSGNFLERVFSPDRVLHPMKRCGSGWERITWSDAAALTASRIESAVREFGPMSVLYFKDAGSIAGLKLVNERFFNLLGGGTFAGGSLCGGAGIAGQTADFGIRTSHDPADLANSRMVIIWGRNPAWTNVHLIPILKEARRRGASLVLIDPVRTATARLCDRHIQPVPGTDRYLALGIARVLAEEDLIDRAFLEARTEGHENFLRLAAGFSLKKLGDITDISTEHIKQLALDYGSIKPASILGGWGLQRWRAGGNTYRCLDALGALTGNIGLPGGGVSHGMDETRWFDKSTMLRDKGKERREIPRPRIGSGVLEATDPPVKVAIITGANPVAQCPSTGLVREALRSIEFTVVADMFMTDTAREADLVLPSTHFLQERDIVASYWHNFIMPVNPAQGRLGEEKTDLEFFALLAGCLGLGSAFPADPGVFLESLAGGLTARGISPERITAGPVRSPGAVDVPFRGGSFPTPSGRFRFVQEVVDVAEVDKDAYPYLLLSPHPHERTHSQLPGVQEASVPEIQLPPAVAGKHGIARDDKVLVESPHGALICRAVITDTLRPETVLVYEGSWDSLGGSVNRLTSDDLSDMGDSATYYDVRCKLSRVGDRCFK